MVKRYYINSRYILFRLLYVIKYKYISLTGGSIDKLIYNLPCPLLPPVYWTNRSNIKYHGTLISPNQGCFCTTEDLKRSNVQKLQTIYEEADLGSRKGYIHETIRSIFLFGHHYSTTPQYLRMLNKIASKEMPQGCSNIDDINRYFHRLQKAFDSIKYDGYKSQRQLKQSDNLEIQIHILQNGELCLVEGNHRIRIAEILNVEKVCFLIKGVHFCFLNKICKQWSLPPHKAIKCWLNSNFEPEYKNEP
jgi:hypothetical protein